MRELTQQEINQANEFFTHYSINKSNSHVITIGLELELEGKTCIINDTTYQPIPRKEFDITKFDFGDSDIWKVQITKHGNDVIFFTEYGSKHSTVNKEKTIALAKHFKLTAEDLK